MKFFSSFFLIVCGFLIFVEARPNLSDTDDHYDNDYNRKVGVQHSENIQDDTNRNNDNQGQKQELKPYPKEGFEHNYHQSGNERVADNDEPRQYSRVYKQNQQRRYQGQGINQYDDSYNQDQRNQGEGEDMQYGQEGQRDQQRSYNQQGQSNQQRRFNQQNQYNQQDQYNQQRKNNQHGEYNRQDAQYEQEDDNQNQWQQEDDDSVNMNNNKMWHTFGNNAILKKAQKNSEWRQKQNENRQPHEEHRGGRHSNNVQYEE